MPRKPRIKSEEFTYHIMVRSIRELKLFKDNEDKDMFLSIVKNYQNTYRFKVYSYCLMDNHAHIEVYANGADISTIMHGINHKYAIYYNRRHGRCGHLFQDRFKSNIVDTDRYLISLSGYIHNNPTKIGRDAETYPYSSYGIYLGYIHDKFNLVDSNLILSMYSKEIFLARKLYKGVVEKCTDENDVYDTEFTNEGTEYRSQKSILIRDYSIDDIIRYVSEKAGVEIRAISSKHCHKTTEMRAICAFFFRCFCNIKCKDICNILGNITQSRVSKLCSMGLDILNNNTKYKGMIEEFLERYKVA